jgi:hypothetical protein
MEESKVDLVEDETLEKLEEINQDITKLEQKLEAIPIAEQLDTSKYNRKQRRRLQRAMIRDEKVKQNKLEQKGNTFVTRKEFVGLFQSMQKLRDRLYFVDVLTAGIEKLLISKNIITEEELKTVIEEENEKAKQFQEIQQGEKDYENRLKKCVELKIDPNMTVIGRQIYEDPELAFADKMKLAEEYKLEVLLNIFKSQMGNMKNNDSGIQS